MTPTSKAHKQHTHEYANPSLLSMPHLHSKEKGALGIRNWMGQWGGGTESRTMVSTSDLQL